MKLTIRLIILILGVFVLLYFWQIRSESVEKTELNSVNQVSLVASKTKKSSQTQKNTKSDAIQQDLSEFSNLPVIKKDKEKVEEQELDYITAYRDWQYFDNCYTDVEDFHNDRDPLETLAGRFSVNLRESQTEPTPQQNQYYQHHVDICKSLIDDEEDDFSQIKQKLLERFRSIIPKTSEEKQLQHAIEMSTYLRKIKKDFSKSHRRTSVLSQEKIDQLNAQIAELTTTMMAIYDGNDELSPEQAVLFKKYSKEIEQIRLVIERSKQFDLKAIKKIQEQIDGYVNSIDDYMHNVTSPDAFILLANIIYNFDIYQQQTSLLKAVKLGTGIQDVYYLNILKEVVIPLVACSMDYPCDAESDFMLSYCLGLKDSMFNQACGRGLEDFYFSFYIGANQLNDVNNYFNFLVNRYEN